MTRVNLLEQLKLFTEEAVKDFILPVRQQKEDAEPPPPRAAKVHLMRLEKSTAAMKAAPYILHQVLTGRDAQPAGDRIAGSTVVRSIFCVYSEDEQEGALWLLGLMERLRIALLEQVVIGDQFRLNLADGLEIMIYPDDTAPYYTGEMLSTWHVPSVERKVNYFGTD